MNQVEVDNRIVFILLKLAEDIKALQIEMPMQSLAENISHSFHRGYMSGITQAKVEMIKFILSATKEMGY